MTLLAVDWGTSSLRGALLDADGRTIDEKRMPRGILSVPAGGFGAVFGDCFGGWMARADGGVLISGMAGSRQGWVEAPYCPCPAGSEEIAARIMPVDHDRIRMVPGLRCVHDGVPDVMRGEEVQILGAMALTGLRDGLFVLPGTHNKWATVAHGRITGFRTFMTGEFYALLSQHSILARTLDAAALLDEAAFMDGVTRAGNGQGLLHNAFGARTLALFDRMPADQLASYLSGMLVGEELRTATPDARGELVLIGAPALTGRYALALRAGGAAMHTLGDEATWAGLHALAAFG